MREIVRDSLGIWKIFSGRSIEIKKARWEGGWEKGGREGKKEGRKKGRKEIKEAEEIIYLMNKTTAIMHRI